MQTGKSCKSLVRVIKFEGVVFPRKLSSVTETRTDASKESAKKRRKIDANTAEKASIFDASSQRVSEVASEPQKVAVGGCPGGPQRLPRAPRAPLERPRDASGAPAELARSAQRVQQGTGDLKTPPWDLKKLTPEASGTSFWSLRGLFCDIF